MRKYTCADVCICTYTCSALTLHSPVWHQSGTHVWTTKPPSQCAAVCCSVAQCAAVCCSVAQCAAVWRSVLQCAAVCCSVLQCATVCCSVLQYAAVCCSMLQCAAVCCSVLQYAAVCCSMLQCAAVCLTIFAPYILRRVVKFQQRGLKSTTCLPPFVSSIRDLDLSSIFFPS